jgi:hypothetical protein
VVSVADTQLRGAAARGAFGVTGAGVEVGVISDSFDRDASAPAHAADDVASGDLPGGASPCGFTTPVDVLAEDAANTSPEDEGRAMLQVVHDLAPGAALAFAAGTPESAFAPRVQSLWQTRGARVIVDDLAYADEPYFQDGPLAVAANAAVAHDAAYYSSAGNNNFIQAGADRGSWEAPAYRNAACPALPDPEQGCMDFGGTNAQRFVLAAGGTLTLDLQWAEPWFGVTTDIDAFLLDGAGHVLASSDDDNTGTTQVPFEFVSYRNAGRTRQSVFLVIANFTGIAGPRLKWTLTQPSGSGVVSVPTAVAPDFNGPAIFGHNGAGAVTSVAAVPFDDATTVEGFSSRGPVTHYFGPVTSRTPAAPLPAPEVLAKPDLAATDGAATTFFGQQENGVWRFFGTSEAAPHAAAVGALEMQLNPALSATAIMAAERSTARPLAGFSPAAQGTGLVDAAAALGAVQPAATPAATPAPTRAAPPAPAPPAPAPPAEPPTLKIAARQHLARRAVRVTVTCPQACSGRIAARLAIRRRHGKLALHAVRISIAAGRSRTLRVAITGRALRLARRALRRHRTVTVRLGITLAATTTKRTVRLVR